MLTENDLTLLCSQLNLSHQARAVVSTIQSSPPSRRVGSGGKNVPVLYTSRKMGVTIQAESYKNELAGVYEMEHDPTVLAFYDQPVRRVGAYRIPVGDGRSWSEHFWTKELT